MKQIHLPKILKFFPTVTLLLLLSTNVFADRFAFNSTNADITQPGNWYDSTASRLAISADFTNTGNTWTMYADGSIGVFANGVTLTSINFTIGSNAAILPSAYSTTFNANGFTLSNTSYITCNVYFYCNVNMAGTGTTGAVLSTNSCGSCVGQVTNVYMYGNLTMAQTTNRFYTSGAFSSNLYFANTSSTFANPQLITGISTATNTDFSANVTSGVYVQVGSGGFSNNFSTAGHGFFVNSGGNIIYDASNVMSGNGIFNLSAGGSLYTANANGIFSTTATGSVQNTGASGRVFDKGANYIYNGSVIQVSGSGLPTSLNTAGGSVSINNTAGVRLSATTTIGAGDTLNLINGSLNNSAANLVLSAGSYIQRDNGTMSVTPTSMTVATNQVNLLYCNLGTNTLTVTTGFELPATFYGNLTINKPGATIKLNAAKTIAGAGYGNVTISNGTLSANAFNMILSVGNWVNNGTFTAGTTGVSFTGASGAQTIGGSSNNNFYNLTISNALGVSFASSGITQTIGSAGLGVLTCTNGIIGIGANTLEIACNIAGMSAAKCLTGSSSSNITIDGSGAIAGSLYFDQTSATTKTINNFILNRSGSNVTLGNALTVGNTLSLIQGTLVNSTFLTMSAGPTTIQVDKGVLSASPVFSVSANVIYGDFGANGSVTTGHEMLPSSGVINNITFAKGAVSGEIVTLGQSPTVTGTVNITGGTNVYSVAGAAKIITMTGAGGLVQTGTSVFTGGSVIFGFAGTQTLSIDPTCTAGFSAVTINSTTTVSSAASTFSVSGAWTNNNSISAFSNSGTVIFNGAAAQSITGSAGTTFNNVTIVNALGVTLGISTNVSGNLTINSGSKLIDGAKTLTLSGNFTNNGTLTATGTMSLIGSGVQTISGASSFNNLTINNTSSGSPATNGVTLASNITVTGILAFTSGIINAGSNAVYLSHCTGANVTGAGASNYVYGKLSKSIAGCTTVNYEVGDNDYSPVFLTFNVAGSGTVTALSTYSVGAEPHFSTSGLLTSAAINKFWTLSGAVVTATSVTPVFTYNAGDINGGSDVGFNGVEDVAGGGTWNNVNSTRGTNVMSVTPVAVSTYAGNYIFGTRAPTLVAQTSPVPTVDNSYTVSFSDVGGWGASINDIKVQVGAGSLNDLGAPGGSSYTVTVAGAASKIVFKPSASSFLQTSGIYTISVGSSSSSFPTAAVVTQTVNPGVARQLYMSTQPVSPGHNGCTFATAPVVGFKDQYSNITSTYALGKPTVTATAVVSPAWTIGGTFTLIPSGTPSVCAFSTLTASNASGSVSGATILFTASGGGATISSVTSGTFGIPARLSVSGTQCAGSTLTVVDPGTGGGTYTWTPTAGLSPTTGSPIVATPSSNTLYTVTAAYGGGCTAKATFSVLPSISISPTQGCPPSQLFNVTGSGYSTYSWSPTTSLSPTSGTAVTASPTSNIIYTVTASFGGCSVTSTVPFYGAIPTATITGTTTICNGSVATLSVSGVANGNITLSPSGSFTLNGSGFGTFTVNPSVTTTYTISAVTVGSGCSGSGIGTGSAVITVNATPTGTITGTTTICNGSVVTLSVTGTANAGVALNPSGSFTLNGSGNGTFTVAPSVTTTYSISSLLLADGCSASGTGSAVVTVNAIPTATITGTTTICNGSVVTLSVTGTANAGVTLSPSGSFTLDGSGNGTFTVAPSSNTTYNIASILSSAGCTGGAGTGSAVVTVNAVPTGTITGTTTICNGSVVTLSVTGTANAGVTLSPSGTFTLDGSGNATFTVAPSSNTTYTISSLSSGAGCTGGGTGSAVVTVNSIPSGTITGTTTICNGTVVTLSVTGTANAGITLSPSGTFTLDGSGNGTFTVTPSTTTTYTISSLLSGAGCTGSGTGSAVVTVNGIPTATITGTTIICNGSVVTLSVTGTANAGVSLSPSGTFTLNGSGYASYTVAPVTSTTYTIASLSSTAGCAGGAGTGSAVITVNALPTATITGTTTICNGTSMVITANGVPNGVVTFSDGGIVTLDFAGIYNYTVSPSVTTDYTITNVENLATGCFQAGTGDALITVNAVPTATISGTTSICTGNSTVLAISGVAGAAINISDGGNITLDGSGAGSYTVTPSVTTTYTLSTVTLSGCSQAGSGSAVVTVNALAVGTITGTSSICNGSTAVLSVTGTSSAVVHFSDGGNITLDGSGNGTYSVSPTSSTTYTITSIVSGAGCTGNGTGNAVITVNAIPTGTITGTTTICNGSVVTLSVTGTANAGVTLSPSGTFTLDGSGNGTFTVAPSSNTTFTISSLLSAAGCSGSGTGSAVVTVNAIPTGTISGTTAICNGGSAVLSVSGTPSAGVNFSDGGNITLDGSGNGTYTVTPVITTTYTISSLLSVAGCSGGGTGSAIITVNAIPTGTITGTTTICNGSVVTLSVTGTPSASINFSDGGNTTLNGSGNGTYSVTPSVTTTYTITSVSLSGCTQAGTGSAIVTVNAIPTGTITGTTAICNGSVVTLSVTGTANTGVTLSPSGTFTLDGSGNATYTVAPSSNTTFTISALVSSAGCSGSGTGSALITVNAIPTGTISGTTSICNGSAAVLSVTGTSSAGVNFSDGGNITLDGSGNGTYSVTPSVTTTYTITSVSLGGCLQAGTGNAVVTVNAVPTGTISGTTNICNGSVAVLSVTGTGGAFVIFSDGGNISLSLGGNGTYSVTPSITTTYSITNVSMSGCSQAGTGNVTVTVNPVPSATVSGTTTICAGSTAILSVTGTASAAINFSDGGNITLDGSGNGTYTVTPPSLTMPITYTISAVSLGGCTQAGSGSAVITVNTMPTATVSGTTTICNGATVVLTVAGSANAGIAFSDGGNITLNISGNGTYSVSPVTTTTYTITVSDLSTGCTQAGSGSPVVTVNALPTATITGTTSICSGNSAVLVLNGTPAAIVNISDGGNVTLNGSGTANYTVTPVTTISYTITSVVNVCTGSGSGSVVVTVNPLPIATITGTTSIYLGGVATLSLTGTPSATVTVSDGGLVTLNGSGIGLYTVSPSITTVYSVTAIVAALTGCTGSGTGSATVTLNGAPTATVTGTTNICAGSNAVLPVDGTAGATVIFSDGGNITLNGSGSGSYTVTPVSSTTYTITSVNILSSFGIGTGSATVTVISLATASITPVTATCIGYSTAVTFNGTPSAVISYSVTGGSTLTGTLDPTTGNYQITIPPSTTATVTLISVTNGGLCVTNINATVAITPTPLTWLGTSGSNWNISSNWNCNILPSSTDVVLIPNTATQPVISSGGAGNTGSLTIASGASVDVQSFGNLNVYGNLNCSGSITDAGMLNLVGSGTQTISGYANVVNINLNNSHGAIMNSTGDSLFINGLMLLTSGTLTTSGNGNLVIVTDSSGTSGQIGVISPGGGTISGNVTMKQYIRYGHRAYRLWGHPFTGSIPMSQLEHYIDITGFGGASNGFTPTTTNNASSWWYDNHAANAGLSLDPGWIEFKTCNSNPANPADTNNFKQFEGIRFLDRGYQGQGLDGTPYTPGTSIICDYGPINIGNANIPIKNYGLGKAYNSVSNPYPSPVDIGTVIYNAAQAGRILGNLFYVWDPYLSTSGAWANIAYINTTTATPIPFYIAPNTSFQVRAINSASITPVFLNFTENNKSTTVSAVPGTSVHGDLRSIEVQGFTMLTVYDNTYHPYDTWYMNFNDAATDGEDEKLDGGKPVNPDLNFYSWSADNTKLAADARPYESGKVIPLGFYTDLAQTYIIKVSSYVAPDGAQVYLHDKLLNTFTKLEQGAEYKFNITNDARTQGDARFEINLDPTGITQPEVGKMLVSMMPNPTNDEVNISFNAPKAGNTALRVVDITGVCVYSENLGVLQTGNTRISLAGFASGVYMVEITNGNTKVVQRLIKE